MEMDAFFSNPFYVLSCYIRGWLFDFLHIIFFLISKSQQLFNFLVVVIDIRMLY